MRLRDFILMVLVPAMPVMGADLATKETPVGHLALPFIADSLVVSPDSTRVAFAAKAGDPTLAEKGVFINPKLTNPADDSARAVVNPICLYIDGHETIPFDGMSLAVFSPDSKRIGYAGREGRAWQLVLDGKTVVQDADDAPANPIIFSPDSAHVAWVVQKDSQFLVTVDGRPWPVIGAGAMGAMAFSPDSKHVAAAVHARAAWTIYVDGTALPAPPGGHATTTQAGGAAPRLERFGQFRWLPDSSGVAFYGAFVGGTWQVFSQSLEGNVPYVSLTYDGIMKGSPEFSPDGRQLAFGVSTRNKWNVVTAEGLGAAESAPASRSATAPAVVMATATSPGAFDQLLGESLRYYFPAGEAGQRGSLLYLAQQNKKWRLYINNKAGEDSFDAISADSFNISPDRKHYAFAAMQDGQTLVIRDGAVLGRYAELGGVTMVFSPDSQHLAYVARLGSQWCMCVDGVAGTPFVAIASSPPAFSPDSLRVAFEGSDAQKSWRLIVGKDGEERSKPYEAFLKGSHVMWRADGTLAAVAILKKVALRLEAKP